MVSGLLPLRPYQRDALDSVTEILTKVRRPAIVLPTGGGKTVVFAHMAKEWLDANPGQRIMILVHTDELVQQAHAKVLAIAPHLDVGIVKATRRDVRADVIVASVQSLRSAARRAEIRHVGLIIVDECHHATAKTYRAILEHYGCLIGDLNTFALAPGTEVPAVGFTATLARGDGGPLGEVWQDVAYQRDIAWMVRKRYLVPPRGKAVEVPDFDLSSVRTSGKDFREGDLGDALVDSLAPQVVAKAYNVYAQNRCPECLEAIEQLHEDSGEWVVPSYCPNEACGTSTGAGRTGIAFFPTVASAYVFAEAFNEEGIKTEVVHGTLPTEERRAILSRLESGVTQVVCNCMVLTEGFDSPRVSCIVVGRPTKSKPLYIQMVGRGLRVDPSQPYEAQDCLILAVTPEAARQDLCSIVDLSTKPIKEPRDGATLIELEDEWDEEEGAGTEEPGYYSGAVVVRDFDPLAARSTKVWTKTEAGLYFVPAGEDAYVFLCPGAEPSTYSVAWVGKDRRAVRYVCCADAPSRRCRCGQREAKPGGFTEHVDLDLEMAMAWAEDLAVDMGADPFESLTKKTAPWRRRRATDYPKMITKARGLGIVVDPARLEREASKPLRAGELSDLINKVIATRRIEPVVERVIESRRPA